MKTRITAFVLGAILIVEILLDAGAFGEAMGFALLFILIAGRIMRAFRVTFRGPIRKAWRPLGIVLAIQWLMTVLNDSTQRLNDGELAYPPVFWLISLAVSIIVLWITYRAPKDAWTTKQSAAQEPTKRCPFCAEKILVDAKKYRYCGEYLESQRR